MAAPAAPEAQTEHKEGFPPFEPEHFPSQLLWLAITFAAIYVFVSRVVVKRVGGAIAARAERISNDLDQAAAAKTRADEAMAAYEKSLSEARNRAQGIARETRDAMNAEADGKRKAVEADLAARLAVADTQIAARKASAMANVAAIAEDTASALVEKLTGRAADAAELKAGLALAAKS